MRRIQHRDHFEQPLKSNTWAMVPTEVPEVLDVSDSESEEDETLLTYAR